MAKIKRSSIASTLSLTPLIDVVFLLLIFFLVTSEFEEEETTTGHCSSYSNQRGTDDEQASRSCDRH